MLKSKPLIILVHLFRLYNFLVRNKVQVLVLVSITEFVLLLREWEPRTFGCCPGNNSSEEAPATKRQTERFPCAEMLPRIRAFQDASIAARGDSGKFPAAIRLRSKQAVSKLDVGQFLEWYQEYCNAHFKRVYGEDENEMLEGTEPPLPTCDCVSRSLRGRGNLNLPTFLKGTVTDGVKTMKSPPFPDITWPPYTKRGGVWKPRDCVARQRVAIIVPYMNRAEHLKVFVRHTHSVLRRQLLSYRIIVVEQVHPIVFNKGALMNAGFKEALNVIDGHNFDCFIFHDVDMLAEDDRNFYTCTVTPRHVGSNVDKFNYRVLYWTLFGGATAFTRDDFERVNGFTNLFYGWGGEDDEMAKRIFASNMTIFRYPPSIARYTMIPHGSDSGNPRPSGWKLDVRAERPPATYPHNGLDTLSYKRVSLTETPLYTLVEIALPEGSFMF